MVQCDSGIDSRGGSSSCSPFQQVPDSDSDDLLSPGVVVGQLPTMVEEESMMPEETHKVFCDLKPAISSIVPGRPLEDTDFKSWTLRHPESWQKDEVLDWVYYVAQESNMDLSLLQGEKFNSVTGTQLVQLSCDEFCKLEPTYGAKLYDCFNDLVSKTTYELPMDVDMLTLPQDMTSLVYEQGTTSMLKELITDDPSQEFIDVNSMGQYLPRPECHPSHRSTPPSSYNTMATIDLPGYNPRYQHHHQQHPDVYDMPAPPPAHQNPQSYPPPPSPPFHDLSIDIPRTVTDTELWVESACQVKRRPPGRPPKFLKDGSVAKPRGRKPGQPSKCNHLWEFILDLLKDSHYNPSHIRWENKKEGIFRIVQSAAVAQMWGKKKNNPSMNYEKLSRAMRFCRTSEVFAEVPKEGKYPKKLCFRFGPKAFGWQDI